MFDHYITYTDRREQFIPQFISTESTFYVERETPEIVRQMFLWSGNNLTGTKERERERERERRMETDMDCHICVRDKKVR
jgi:hypothetical protein